MKNYYIGGKVSESKLESILFDIDNGAAVKLISGRGVNFETANKLAAFGLPVFMKGNMWDEHKAATAENLLNSSAECVIVEMTVSKQLLDTVYKAISEIESNSKLWPLKICLVEPIGIDPNDVVSDQEWNELIVMCYDHNLCMCWEHDAAGNRYSAYLKEVCDI